MLIIAALRSSAAMPAPITPAELTGVPLRIIGEGVIVDPFSVRSYWEYPDPTN